MNINKRYNGNLDWNVAGMFAHDNFWIPFLNGLKNNDIELPFQYIYGTPFGIKIGGGRITGKNQDNIGYLETHNEGILKSYIDLGIGCRLTLSNHLINPRDYEDNNKLNKILNYLNNFSKNGVIISNDGLNKYIKDNYPNLQRICSVIKPALDVGWGNDTAEYYNNLCENYDLVVVNCGFAKDLNKINQLRYKEKIEVLVNTRCILNCKLAKMHYDIIAEEYLIDPITEVDKDLELQTRESLLLKKCLEMKRKNILGGANFSVEEVQKLIDCGIQHFKLEGRNWLLESVARDVGYYICDEILFARVCKNITGAEI